MSEGIIREGNSKVLRKRKEREKEKKGGRVVGISPENTGWVRYDRPPAIHNQVLTPITHPSYIQIFTYTLHLSWPRKIWSEARILIRLTWESVPVRVAALLRSV